MATTRVAAIVLTGGRSRRMGTDKASLVVNGVAMLDRVKSVLAETGIATVVVAGSEALPDPDADAELGGQGPLAGIASGWAHLQTLDGEPVDPVVVLSCDLPALTSSVVRDLVRHARTNLLGAVADDGERLQPLVAAYRPATLDQLAAAYERGERSVRKCLPLTDLSAVAFDKKSLSDADTPADLAGYHVEWPKNTAPDGPAR